jgi:hypothetical protein
MREIRQSGLTRGKEVGGHCLCALIPWLPSLLYYLKTEVLFKFSAFCAKHCPIESSIRFIPCVSNFLLCDLPTA